MGRFDELEGIAKRQMTLFFMVDVSGSMAGEKIGTVNSTMREIIPELAEMSASNADAAIKVAVLTFSKDCKWINPRPIDISEFEWSDLTVGTVTNFGAACAELNSKLSRNEFMKDAVGAYAPVIILLSDGSPTDNYRNGLGALEQNNWYKAAIKAAIAIGRDVDIDVLEDFTKTTENVIRVYNPEELKRWIKFVTITASKIGSNSSLSTESKHEQLGKKLIDERKVDEVDIDNLMSALPDCSEWSIEKYIHTRSLIEMEEDEQAREALAGVICSTLELMYFKKLETEGCQNIYLPYMWEDIGHEIRIDIISEAIFKNIALEETEAMKMFFEKPSGNDDSWW